MASREYRIVRDDVSREALAIVPLGPLGNHGQATLWKKDLDELIAMGLRTNWTLNNGVVVASGKSSRNGHVSVARVLTGAKAGERVKYRDRNSRNLRRENLYIVEGFSMRQDRLYV